ncbi:GNAT family N-acetyltransferase [Streptomyces aidingensis]|uniref:Ribosomal protein S18 acetylase RimI n=1 Tax=Streptomyces aidingensis TaxID=910347 RepID=A0A1I1RKU0_9ACTN|nr:GNAT family N-acetyltransferase [Streptomyces aidingensis]SFD34956.1 Ribosomal protein S18 acetylase RimI [Streptomyces aidingensis]
MDITIREALAEELLPAADLLTRAYLDDGLLTFGTDDPYLATLRDTPHRAAEAELLVAVDPADGALLGTVTFAPEGPYAEISRPQEAEFRMLAVSPAARGRGVGEALVRACIGRAQSRGMRGIVLSTSPLMHTAHRLYRRLGFARTPERDWSPTPDFTLHVYTLTW